jgi:hypothetical protein
VQTNSTEHGAGVLEQKSDKGVANFESLSIQSASSGVLLSSLWMITAQACTTLDAWIQMTLLSGTLVDSMGPTHLGLCVWICDLAGEWLLVDNVGLACFGLHPWVGNNLTEQSLLDGVGLAHSNVASWCFARSCFDPC